MILFLIIRTTAVVGMWYYHFMDLDCS
jgi:hypothetical protein